MTQLWQSGRVAAILPSATVAMTDRVKRRDGHLRINFARRKSGDIDDATQQMREARAKL